MGLNSAFTDPALRNGWPKESFLSNLSSPTVRELFASGHRAYHLKNYRILGDHPMIVLSGYIRLDAAIENGTSMTLRVVGPGELVGESALIAQYNSSRRQMTHQISTITDTQVLVLPVSRFIGFLQRDPHFSSALTLHIIQNLHDANQRRVETLGLNAQQRIARVLVELAQKFGQEHPDGIAIKIGLTQRDIGSMAGTSVVNAERVLRSLREGNIVSTLHRRITILDIDALEKVATMGRW